MHGNEEDLPVRGPSATSNSIRLHCPLRTELHIQREKYGINRVGGRMTLAGENLSTRRKNFLSYNFYQHKTCVELPGIEPAILR